MSQVLEAEQESMPFHVPKSHLEQLAKESGENFLETENFGPFMFARLEYKKNGMFSNACLAAVVEKYTEEEYVGEKGKGEGEVSFNEGDDCFFLFSKFSNLDGKESVRAIGGFRVLKGDLNNDGGNLHFTKPLLPSHFDLNDFLKNPQAFEKADYLAFKKLGLQPKSNIKMYGEMMMNSDLDDGRGNKYTAVRELSKAVNNVNKRELRRLMSLHPDFTFRQIEENIRHGQEKILSRVNQVVTSGKVVVVVKDLNVASMCMKIIGGNSNERKVFITPIPPKCIGESLMKTQPGYFIEKGIDVVRNLREKNPNMANFDSVYPLIGDEEKTPVYLIYSPYPQIDK